MGTLWVHAWGHYRDTLGRAWVTLGTLEGHCGDMLEDTLETLQGHTRDTLGTHWGHCGYMLGDTIGHAGDTMETLW